MANGLSSFVWNVPPGGYAWVPAGTDWVLTEQKPESGTSGVRQYAPLEEQPVLFRSFRELLPNDREALRAFANQYGYLGIKPDESLADWSRAINELREAIALWDMVHDLDFAGLRACVRWEERDSSTLQPGHWYYARSPHSPRQRIEDVPGLFHPGDVVLPARILVHRWVNAHVRHAAPRLVYDPTTGTSVFQIVPHNLLAALWVQFMEAIAGNKQYRRCRECNNWFAVSASERTPRLFCGDACKAREYRRRKEQAQQRKKRGNSGREIGKKRDTDSTTSKKRLTKKKRKE